MEFIVLFERQIADEVFTGNETIEERFAQMLAEFAEFDRHLVIRLLHYHVSGADFDLFATAVEWYGDCKRLHDYLQAAYDEVGVSGAYQIVGAGENIKPLSSLTA